MGGIEMSKKTREKKDRNKDAVAKAQSNISLNVPMNKYFLMAVNEDKSPKYPVAMQIYNYRMMGFEKIHDVMRQISAYVAQLLHHQNRIKRLNEQHEGEVTERDKYGKLLHREELKLEIIASEIAIPRELDNVRSLLVDKLITKIDEVVFTGKMCNDYILEIEKSVNKLGYVLCPDKLEIVFPKL